MAVQAELVDRRPIVFVETTFRDQLDGLLRYARFIDGETPREWVRLLGPDVLSRSHPHVTAEITQDFITVNNRVGGADVQTTTEDQRVLTTAALVHDWGELNVDGIGVGDVSFDQKTDGDEAVEKTVFDKVLDAIPDDPEIDKTFLRRAYEEVVRGKPGRLWEMFNAVERIGYLETAIRAYKGVDGQRIRNWRGLVGNVLSNQIETLITYAGKYPYVSDVLERERQVLHEIYGELLTQPVPLDADQKPSYDVQKLLGAGNHLIRYSM